MDLAQIRKKAKKQSLFEVDAVSPGRAETDDAPVEFCMPEGRLSGQEASRASQGAEPEGEQVSLSQKQIDALFQTPEMLDLATEEMYQQGLAAVDVSGSERRKQWLAFTLGTEEYALDICSIREIIKAKEITDIPRVPSYVLGIISLRGIIVPVFDLRQRLNLGKAELTLNTRIIVCQLEEQTVGLLVDKITQVVQLPESGIEPPPSVLTGIDREMVQGVGRCHGQMMILLKLESILNTENTGL